MCQQCQGISRTDQLIVALRDKILLACHDSWICLEQLDQVVDSHLHCSLGNTEWSGGRYKLTGFSAGSAKKILMTTSNSPQPVSLISYGGFVTTEDGEQYITAGGQWRAKVTSDGAGVALMEFKLNLLHIN